MIQNVLVANVCLLIPLSFVWSAKTYLNLFIKVTLFFTALANIFLLFKLS